MQHITNCYYLTGDPFELASEEYYILKWTNSLGKGEFTKSIKSQENNSIVNVAYSDGQIAYNKSGQHLKNNNTLTNYN